MWNYLSFPALLLRPGIEVREIAPCRSRGAELRRLEVDFPEHLDTHSRRQTFYGASGGLPVRNDCVAAVVRQWARPAHLGADHVEAGGLVSPPRRWVRPIGP